MSEEFIIKKADGRERKVSGYKYSAPAPDAKKFAASKVSVEDLPPKVDLRQYMTPVESQGQLSSCVANAVAGAYEYLVKRFEGEDAYDVSRLFVYYNARELEEVEIADQGSFISLAIQGLKKYGACAEETWEYDEGVVNEKPSEEAYEEAGDFLVEDTQLIPNDLNAWKQALAEGYPIIFGISLYKSFDKHKKKGHVPMPTNNEASRESHGGHSMLCVGYSDPDQFFIVRNSWGTDWGDEGHCYIPYNYLTNDKFNDGDNWIIRQSDELEVDQDTWGDDSSIAQSFDSELAEMPDEDYENMLDATGDFALESRIGLILLHAANADNDLSEEEWEKISVYMDKTLESLGVDDLSSRDVLQLCEENLGDEELLEESITLLGDYLSSSFLAGFVASMEEIVGSDDFSVEEEDFVYRLVDAWQIENSDDDEYDDDDEYSDEDEYDDEDEK
ncbi:MAG: C1 family peptidase [Spirochaetota bacterium]